MFQYLDIFQYQDTCSSLKTASELSHRLESEGSLTIKSEMYLEYSKEAS